MGDLTRIVCIVVLEAGRSKTKMPTDLAPGEDPTSSFERGLLAVSSQGGEEKSLCLPFYKGIHPIKVAPASVPNLILITSQSPTSTQHHLGHQTSAHQQEKHWVRGLKTLRRVHRRPSVLTTEKEAWGNLRSRGWSPGCDDGFHLRKHTYVQTHQIMYIKYAQVLSIIPNYTIFAHYTY